MRASQGDFPNSPSGYGGVGQGSNVAVHDATIGNVPQQNGLGRDHPGSGAMTPSGVVHNSSGGIEGGRRVDGRGPVGGVGVGNGDGQHGERKTFGQKLADILTCRCS